MTNIIEIIEEKLQDQKDALYEKDLVIQGLKDHLADVQKENEKLRGLLGERNGDCSNNDFMLGRDIVCPYGGIK